MNELGLAIEQALPWFSQTSSTPYVLVQITSEHTKEWPEVLALPFRRCYLTDSLIAERTQNQQFSEGEIIAAALPEPSAVMAGDFGEILAFIYHVVAEHPKSLIGPKKWRLKEVRTKAAPYSDIVHFSLPNWPNSCTEDTVYCSEVKTKSKPGKWSPIADAIDGCGKDRKSRLLKTLLWLKDRATLEDLGELKVDHIDRFLKATDHPPSHRKFRAIVVICQSLYNNEIATAPRAASPDYTLVIITIPELYETYSQVFTAVRATSG